MKKKRKKEIVKNRKKQNHILTKPKKDKSKDKGEDTVEVNF